MSDVRTNLPQRLHALVGTMNEWIQEHNLEELAQKSDRDGATYATVRGTVIRFGRSIQEEMLPDVVALDDAMKNEQVCADVKVLSDISAVLRSDIFESYPASEEAFEALPAEERERLTLVQQILSQIEGAINNEEWAHVRELAETLPTELGIE